MLGALVTHRTVEVDPLIGGRRHYVDAARYIGHVGIRNRGTIGGSVAHADPAAEIPLATLVLGATFHVESATAGRRGIRRGDVRVFYTNGLAPDEMSRGSRCRHSADQGWGFVEYAHQHGDYGLAGAGCLLTLRPDGRVGAVRAAVLSVADRPLLFVADDAVGEMPSERLWRALGEDWARRTEPAVDDADYARRLCAAALTEAMTDAGRRAHAQRGESDDLS